jgi:hypothetical protein
VGLNSLKSLNLTNGYPNKNKNNNNKVKSKPLELRSRVKSHNLPRPQKRAEQVFQLGQRKMAQLWYFTIGSLCLC